MSETIIIGEFTISKLRSGEAVEFDNGVTIIPASDLATTEALRARVAKLEKALNDLRPNVDYDGHKKLDAALSETVEA